MPRGFGVLLAWTIGLGLIAGLIVHQDDLNLPGAMTIVGWWFSVFFLSYAGTLLLDCLGWRAVMDRAERVGLLALVIRRWIGVSMNALIPVAPISFVEWACPDMLPQPACLSI